MILKAAIGDGNVDYFALMSGLTGSRIDFARFNQLVLGNYQVGRVVLCHSLNYSNLLWTLPSFIWTIQLSSGLLVFAAFESAIMRLLCHRHHTVHLLLLLILQRWRSQIFATRDGLPLLVLQTSCGSLSTRGEVYLCV